MEKIELQQYLSHGVERIVRGIAKESIGNQKMSLYMLKHAIDSKKAQKQRERSELRGEHIPPFLIASITTQCNLHCKGCYARANQSCSDHADRQGMLTAKQWGELFLQAEEMGIEFILLAGGEPFTRRDVIEEAGKHRKILFPIFTNGTMIGESYLELLQANPNLIPVISIEGMEKTTNERRGSGVYEKIISAIDMLHSRDCIFGASVTVTKENMDEVMSEKFIKELEQQGAKAIVYVEYVPVDGQTKELAPDDNDRERMKQILDEKRVSTDMLLISFPGDEKTSGGCLAAGRGFFHINAYGGAEPCPFSPYSDTNVKETLLKDVLKSPLFLKLQENGNLTEEHVGGCVLFEQKVQVAELLGGGRR